MLFRINDERCLGFDNSRTNNDQVVINLNAEIEGLDKQNGTRNKFRFHKRTIRLRREAARKRAVDQALKKAVCA